MRGWQIARIAGIAIEINATWLFIFALLLFGIADDHLPRHYPDAARWQFWMAGTIATLLLFGSVIVHELAHSLVARRYGVNVSRITLFIFGGVAQTGGEPKTALSELWIALAGSLASMVIGAVCLGVWSLIKQSPIDPVWGGIFRINGALNIALAAFNMLPGFPLDGGRVLRAALWAVRKDIAWATRWAARVGHLVAMLFIVAGIVLAFAGDWLNGMWLAFIGIFVDNAGRSSYGQIALRKMLDGHTVAEVMSDGCALVPPQLTLDVFVEQYLMGEARRCYPVGTRDAVVGLLTIHGLRQVPASLWREKRVIDAMTPLPALRIVSPETPLWDALRHMTADGVNQLPVLSDGRLVGMVSREHLISFLHARSAVG